jgi:hypothetical protein
MLRRPVFESRRDAPPAGPSHPQPTGQVHHVPEPDQPGAVFGGDDCGRTIHGCIADYEKGGEFRCAEALR